MKRLIFASMLALSTAAHADFYTGNDLHGYLVNERSVIHKALGTGYVAGVLSATQKNHCAPKDVTVGQSVDVVRQFLANNPEHRHMTAAVLVLAAILNAWPCEAGRLM